MFQFNIYFNFLQPFSLSMISNSSEHNFKLEHGWELAHSSMLMLIENPAMVFQLTHLVVSEHERRLPEPLPALLLVEGLGRLQRHVDVHALQGQGETGLLVLDEVKRHLYKGLVVNRKGFGRNRKRKIFEEQFLPKTERTEREYFGRNWPISV